jgi:short-subunit dehydrogenase
MFEKLKPMPPHIFARKVLNAVAKNKAIIIVPAWWRVFWWINRLSPALGIFLAQRSFQHNLKKLGLLPMQ